MKLVYEQHILNFELTALESYLQVIVQSPIRLILIFNLNHFESHPLKK